MLASSFVFPSLCFCLLLVLLQLLLLLPLLFLLLWPEWRTCEGRAAGQPPLPSPPLTHRPTLPCSGLTSTRVSLRGGARQAAVGGGEWCALMHMYLYMYIVNKMLPTLTGLADRLRCVCRACVCVTSVSTCARLPMPNTLTCCQQSSVPASPPPPATRGASSPSRPLTFSFKSKSTSNATQSLYFVRVWSLEIAG